MLYDFHIILHFYRKKYNDEKNKVVFLAVSDDNEWLKGVFQLEKLTLKLEITNAFFLRLPLMDKTNPLSYRASLNETLPQVIFEKNHICYWENGSGLYLETQKTGAAPQPQKLNPRNEQA